MRGRKPQPIQLRLARGNPSKRPVVENAFTPPASTPDMPPHLTGEAALEWRRITAWMADVGILTQADRGVLACYCSAWGRLIEAEASLRELGTIIKSPSGFPIQNPYLAVANKATEQLIKTSAELGITPSARTRIKAPTTPHRDAFDEFIDAARLA